MKIDSITIWQLRIPLRTPVTTAYGTHTMRETALIEMRESSGAAGWGELEALSEPTYNEESHHTALHILKHILAPLILGKEFSSPQDLPFAWQGVRRNFMAKAALETAAWDMWARGQGMPMSEIFFRMSAHNAMLLPHQTEPLDTDILQQTVPVGISIGMYPDVSMLLQAVERARSAGYQRLKIKIAPGKALKQVRAIQAEFPDMPLMVDANGSYSPNNTSHLSELIELGRGNLICIEEPFSSSDLTAHSQLQQHISVPICLDEAVSSLDELRTAHSMGAMRMLNLKIARVGGVSAALQMIRYCRQNGIDMWIGGMYETGIGRALALHLAALPDFRIPGDLSLPTTYLAQDILNEPLRMSGDGITLPTGAGIGVTPSAQLLHAYSIARSTLC